MRPVLSEQALSLSNGDAGLPRFLGSEVDEAGVIGQTVLHAAQTEDGGSGRVQSYPDRA